MEREQAVLYGRKTVNGLQVYLELNREGSRRSYRFPEKITETIKTLLATGLLITAGMDKGRFRILPSRFVIPYLEKVTVDWKKVRKKSENILSSTNFDERLILEREVMKTPNSLKSWLIRGWLLLKQNGSRLLGKFRLSGHKTKEEPAQPLPVSEEKRPKSHQKEQEIIKKTWDKNIKKRSKNKMKTVLSQASLEKLQRLKEELTEE